LKGKHADKIIVWAKNAWMRGYLKHLLTHTAARAQLLLRTVSYGNFRSRLETFGPDVGYIKVMTKRWLGVASGVFGVCLTISAQQAGKVGTLDSFGGALGRTPLTLSDTRTFPFSTPMAWVDPVPNNFLPDWRPSGWATNINLNYETANRQPEHATTVGSSVGYSKDVSKESPQESRDYSRSNPFEYVHGEVGFFYGSSSGGKNHLTDEGGYIYGETGNDKFSIGVGAFYENSNFDFGHRGR
jgi:hypothetical protein